MSETLNLVFPTKRIRILSLDDRDLRSLITNENFIEYSAYTDTYIHEYIYIYIYVYPCVYIHMCLCTKQKFS